MTCRLGWSRGLCLSKGIWGVLLFFRESPCPSCPSLTYIAVNAKGETQSNIGPINVNAVTWGVFPGKEVIQPTVVDPVSFIVRKDEAFQAWKEDWASLYPDGDESKKILLEVSTNRNSCLIISP